MQLISAFVFVLAMAHAEEGHHAAEAPTEMAQRSAKTSSRDVKVPRQLVAEVEKEYREYLTLNKFPIQESLKRELLNVSAEFTQDRVAALHEDLRVNTPVGGGVIDMADFVTPLRGLFRLNIKARDGHGEAVAGKVYYVSHAKERVIDGDAFGAGCGKYMDITSFYNAKMSRGGFELYTAEQRYLSVLAGTFVIIAFTKDTLQVASLTFADSRYPALTCE